MTVNENGLTDEEYKTGEQGQKKPARKRTEEGKSCYWKKSKKLKKDRKKTYFYSSWGINPYSNDDLRNES